MDIKTFYVDGRCDWQVSRPGLAEETGLETAMIISLFTDRRANPDDVLPDGGDDRRGYWADAYSDIEGDRWGSRLWLLEREKLVPETLRRAREYAEEALAWMIEDDVVDRIVVKAEAVEQKLLALSIEIYRPGQAPDRYRFNRYWQGESNAV